MNVLFAGGGTGGHVFPAIAVTEELLKRDPYTQFLFVGSNRGLEARVIPARGFAFQPIGAGALKGMSFVTKVSTIFSMPGNIQAAGKIVKKFSPQVVVGIGGYASAPALIAAALQGRPTMILEQNLIPGLTNRVLAYLVAASAVNFEESIRYFPGNAVTTGNPIRKEFFQVGPPKGEIFKVLIFGGSQGAHGINLAMTETMPQWDEFFQRVHFIHQTGEKDFEMVQSAYATYNFSAEVRPFFEDMPNQFERAHLVVARSGASALSEIAATGRPSILIPLPTSADDHQRKNAEVFVHHGASVMIEQSALRGDSLPRAIRSLLENPEQRQRMAQAAASLANPKAAARIADLIESLAGKAKT